MRKISISRKTFLTVALLSNLHFLPTLALAQAQGAFDQPAETDDSGSFLSGPFSEYGEFENEDEESDEKFFQYGRFFGVGLGLGFTAPMGNAGKLYQGGFPTLDFRLNYWFDFLVALQISVRNSKHSYDVLPDRQTSTNLFRLLAQVKYYFDTKDLAAPITFVSPHIIFGGGYYQRTDTFAELKESENSSTFGLNAGIGFELTFKPKKMYLQIESTANVMTFSDAYDPKYMNSGAGIDDRTGIWFDTVVAIMWTW